MSYSTPFSSSQQRALAITPMVSGTLSTIGSFSIIVIIVRDRKQKLKQLFHRLLFAMSVCDIISSIRLSLSNIPVPKDTPEVWGAFGTTETCTLQGFVAQLSMSVPVYTACLCLFYYLKITHGVPEDLITRLVEPWMHAISILYPLATALVGVFKDLYNPLKLGTGCWVAYYPKGCDGDPDVDCTRGIGAEVYIWAFGGAEVLILFVFIAIAMGSIIWTVYRQAQTMTNKYDADQRRLTWETSVQALLYISAFFLVFIFSSIARLTETNGKESSQGFFVVSMLSQIFHPMQGLLNFFIYIRPRSRPTPRKGSVASRTSHSRGRNAYVEEKPRDLADDL